MVPAIVFQFGENSQRRLQFRVDFINALNHPIFRTGRLDDSGEIFALPSEASLSNAEDDAWALAGTNRPGVRLRWARRCWRR